MEQSKIIDTLETYQLTSYEAATAHRPRIDLFSGSRCLGRHRHLYMQSGCFFTDICGAAVYTVSHHNSIIWTG